MGNWTASAWPILVSAALKSTLVLGAAWLVAWLLRGRSAAARHMVWTAAAAALVALPMLTFGLPALRVRFANAVLPADAGLVFHVASARAAADGAGSAGGATEARRAPNGGREATPARAPGLDGKGAVMLLWMAGVAAGWMQMLAAWAVLWRTRRVARVSPDQDEADALAWSLGIEQPVRVLETAAGMPMTFGVLRPTVLLPAEARAWSGERRRVVLLHELAHVFRGDACTHLLGRTALALYWWNPLAWTAWREFLKERERATDDLVLGTGATASDYAGHLLEIARGFQMRPASAAAGVAMARRSQLEGRLLAILDGRTVRGQHGLAPTLVAVVLAVALMAPVAAVRAQSQAEQNAAPADVEAIIRDANARKNREILDQAAVSYEALHKFAEAQQLREASLAMAGQQSGQQSKDYAIALVKLGNLARRRGAYQDAIAYYDKALAAGDRPEVFTALVNLGRDAFARTRAYAARNPDMAAAPAPDPAKAMEFLTRARNVAENGNDFATALTWIAQVRQSEPDGAAEADSLYRQAMAAADADSAQQALAEQLYAQFLKKQDRAGDAAAIETRAKAIAKARINAKLPQAVVGSSIFKVGGGVKAPALIFKVEPEYTEEARAAKYSGTAVLKVVVDIDGKAKNIEVVDALGLGLDEQAVEAVQQWRFKPGENAGVPVPVEAMIQVNFRLM